MKTVEIKIEGMSCGHCVMAVKKALNIVNGIKVEDVQIGKAVIQVDENTDALEKAINAIDETGYNVINQK